MATPLAVTMTANTASATGTALSASFPSRHRSHSAWASAAAGVVPVDGSRPQRVLDVCCQRHDVQAAASSSADAPTISTAARM